ncbi:MAG TPA: 23S rRNA (adenine(2503)-C(2))-methyltransferase RlmN [Verrucomicrobiales bacterium]|nr:23S rRNA (adenine(2503)-C(2))-methyltransferase RlmN [Verrucomicrobiales bacterium]HIL72226.1 23S rRNA (adenine(2503)-C(2))-methyltransferase RlmN [Verrucomicrobiota bacterium]
MQQPDIKSQSLSDLQDQLSGMGEPTYRSQQITDWLYRKHVSNWDQMTNLSQGLREKLSKAFTCHSLELIRHQGTTGSTQKFLWKLSDGSLIENVLIPANPASYGESSKRNTLCLSTQVGCAYGCKFCASGLDGWKRNLTVDEIVDQVISVHRHVSQVERGLSTEHCSEKFETTARCIDNIVVMGMGEPLANYKGLLGALRILNASWGCGIGARRITVSTSGLVPQIRRLAEEPEQFRLAISLHGATDRVRSKIMPINRKYPVSELMDACGYYQQRNGKMITFEYILIKGINDQLDQVKPLADWARKLDAKVNLIPYNHVDGLPWERPDESVQFQFCDGLKKQRIRVTLRREKGHDIDAACGQLRLRTEKTLSS